MFFSCLPSAVGFAFFLPAVGFALLAAVGFVFFLPAVGFALLPAVGFSLLPAIGFALLPAVGFARLGSSHHRSRSSCSSRCPRTRVALLRSSLPFTTGSLAVVPSVILSLTTGSLAVVSSVPLS